MEACKMDNVDRLRLLLPPRPSATCSLLNYANHNIHSPSPFAKFRTVHSPIRNDDERFPHSCCGSPRYTAYNRHRYPPHPCYSHHTPSLDHRRTHQHPEGGHAKVSLARKHLKSRSQGQPVNASFSRLSRSYYSCIELSGPNSGPFGESELNHSSSKNKLVFEPGNDICLSEGSGQLPALHSSSNEVSFITLHVTLSAFMFLFLCRFILYFLLVIFYYFGTELCINVLWF
ncbi:unnamed protein product [Protopolystoma xenopodis]|uniref:Uncharacterized protein n=1 Tax=Protopolystoma xenopodis TaxID=117903 RepID=A0A3S5FG67_9PLAT|nr:unnamed protein product [Protopolystoma xenopodis]